MAETRQLRRLSWRPSVGLLLSGAACALAAASVLASIPVLFGSPEPIVRITWRDVPAAERAALERQFGLTRPILLDDDIWGYVPSDTSPGTLRAIVTHMSVASTDGIDRRTFKLARSLPLSPRRGGLVSGTRPWMARAAKLLAYILACGSAVMLLVAVLVSPLVPEHVGIRRFLILLRSDTARTVRALPRQAPAWILRGVPIASAQAAGLFRIVFGTAVLLFVAAQPAGFEPLPTYEVDAAQGLYGSIVRWLSAHPELTRALVPWLIASGTVFIAGVATTISFACFVVAFVLWACIFTLTSSAHVVAPLAMTLICLLPARWGDAWSVDAWLRRRWGRRRILLPGARYGFAIWIPRLVLGVALLAAAWSKVGNGFGWILNGTVKYHFLTDLDHAWVTWGPRLTQYHWVAVLMSALAVLVEALAITAAFSRSEAYRLTLAGAAMALLAGFALFQGVLWWVWWIPLIAFLPWDRLGAASDHSVTEAPSFSLAQASVVIALVVQQFVMSAFHVEARPLLSAYDMYSATYGSAEDYEEATNLVYRVVVFENGRPRDLPGCVIDDRSAAMLPAAAAGESSERTRMRGLLAECLEGRRSLEAQPSLTAIALEGDREVYNWDERRFEWKRAVDVIGPVPATWLRQ